MKKRFTAFLTAFLCMSAAITALPAGALDSETAPIIVTDTFTYSNDRPGEGFGFCLETELIDADMMVVGIDYYERNSEIRYTYWVSDINGALGPGLHFCSIEYTTAIEQFGDQQLKIGDLIQVNGTCGAIEIDPPILFPLNEEPFEGSSFTLLGNGVDIFGEEFERVIRLEMFINKMEYNRSTLDAYGVALIEGDVNVDDEMNILDCICISQALMGYGALCDYGRVAGDVNEDNTLDSGDTLMILRELLKLTENFE